MRLTQRVFLATQNRGKYEEFHQLFSEYPEIELLPLDHVIRNPGLLGSVEEHNSYLENAIAKARIANLACHYPIIADDSGLEVAVLEGKPGVRSNRFGQVNPEAIPRISQDEANMRFLIEQLKLNQNGFKSDTTKQARDPAGQQLFTARFVCTLALIVEGILIHATGFLEGSLITERRGNRGFGYDPLFIPKGETRTLAEMSLTEKNAISHRTKAIRALMEEAKKMRIVFAKP